MNELLPEGIQTHGEAPGDSSLNGYGEAVATGAEQHASSAPLEKPRIEPKLEDQRPTKASLTNALPTPKLRPALDVLNRIRYDPNLDNEDHIVGYRDRHDGVQEICAALLKSDTTDEEFIPQHRIKYFKRKSDNMVVWDRFMRLDLIFGSGIKQHPSAPDVSNQHPPPPPPLAPPDELPAAAAADAADAAPPSPQ